MNDRHSERGRAELIAMHLGDVHPCDEPKGWPEFSITLDFYVDDDDPVVGEAERQRVWSALPDLILDHICGASLEALAAIDREAPHDDER